MTAEAETKQASNNKLKVEPIEFKCSFICPFHPLNNKHVLMLSTLILLSHR